MQSLAAIPPHGLLSEALRHISPSTRGAYAGDWQRFADHAGMDASALFAGMVADGQAATNRAVLGYRQAMIDSATAPQTINRRLCAIRHAFNAANQLGLIAWVVNVKGVKSKPIRDTRGPSVADAESMIEHANARDRCIMLLLYHMALRRAEVCQLALKDIRDGRLWVKGKKCLEREPFTMPDSVRSALNAWLMERGSEPGPLFLGVDLSTINRIVRRAGAKIGIHAHPHGLRHTAITRALALTGGDIARVQKFARHARPETTQIYNDSRLDDYGSIAGMIANNK